MTKPVRWTDHALRNLSDREIDRADVDRAIADPESTAPAGVGRSVRMHRYFDDILKQTMLLRVVIDETQSETIVVTVYKTSQVDRYLRRGRP